MVGYRCSGRWVKPHGPVAALLRNLLRSGLRPNGPSNSASRHRTRRPQQQGHAPLAVASETHHPLPWRDNEQAWKERAGNLVVFLLAGRAP